MYRSDAAPVLGTRGPRLGGQNGPAPWAPLIALGAIGILAWLVQATDAPIVLVAAVLALLLAPVLVWPELATCLALFLLYINLPAILTKQHGLPELVAGSFMALLLVPLAWHLIARRSAIRADVSLRLMGALLLVMLAATFRAVDWGVAYGQIFQYLTEGILLYWLILNTVRSRRTLTRVIATLLAAGAVLATLALYQEVTGAYEREFGGLAYRNYVAAPIDAEPSATTRRQAWDRAQGPVDEPNRFAQLLVVLIPFGIALARHGRTRFHRVIAATATLVVLAGIAITLSRGAFVAILLLAIALALVRWVRPRHLGLAAILLVVAIPAVSPSVVPRLLSITNAAHLLDNDPAARQHADGAIRGRMTSMLTALHVFRDHPVLGVGPGQFRYHYLAYVDNPDVRFRDVRTTRRAHTLYFEIGAELGILGLGLFLAIPGLLAAGLWRERRRWQTADPGLSDLATACVLALFGYFTTAIFLHLSYPRYYWLLVAVCGVTLAMLRTARPHAPCIPGAAPDHLAEVHR